MCVAGGLSPADMMGRSAAQGRDPTNIGSKPGQFTIEDVVWGGELAAPWEYPEARFEQKVRALPFERDNAFSAKHDPLGLDREEATGSTTGATDSNSNSEWITDDDSEDDLYTLEELAARRQRYMRNRRRYLAAAAAAGEADPDGVGWEWKGKTRSSSPSPTAPPSVRPSPTASPTVSPVPSATVSPTPRHGAFINCHETTTPDCKDPLPRSVRACVTHMRRACVMRDCGNDGTSAPAGGTNERLLFLTVGRVERDPCVVRLCDRSMQHRRFDRVPTVVGSTACRPSLTRAVSASICVNPCLALRGVCSASSAVVFR